jgi:hypothetical protein
MKDWSSKKDKRSVPIARAAQPLGSCFRFLPVFSGQAYNILCFGDFVPEGE